MIKIKEFIEGDTAVSYEDGLKCKDAINKEMKEYSEEDIMLDFQDVSYVITAFLNPVIGDLILENGSGIMKSIKILNANKNIIEKIKMVRDGALLKREEAEDGIF